MFYLQLHQKERTRFCFWGEHRHIDSSLLHYSRLCLGRIFSQYAGKSRQPQHTSENTLRSHSENITEVNVTWYTCERKKKNKQQNMGQSHEHATIKLKKK